MENIKLTTEMQLTLSELNGRLSSAVESQRNADIHTRTCNEELRRFLTFCRKTLNVPDNYTIFDSDEGFKPKPVTTVGHFEGIK